MIGQAYPYAMQENQRHYANQISAVDVNPTVEENIDIKIRHLEAEIQRLQQSKLDLGPLLKMRIRDIRQAMEY
jgi:hypothetical protein